MGRGGAQPVHSCKASGSITLAYTVDKAGNVISVRRSGGISDPCIVSTSIQWVKQYVKAEKANFLLPEPIASLSKPMKPS
jgi:hypothetical protein